MRRPRVFNWAFVAVVLIVPRIAVAGAVVTNEELAQKVALDLARELEGRLKLESAVQRIALRPEEPSAFNDWFHDQLAPRLLDDGWDVWILQPEQSPQEGSLLFEYRMLKVSLEYLRERHGFLGLGTPKLEREVEFELAGKLKEPASGRLFWQGTLDAKVKDDFDSSQVSFVENEQPDWMAKPKLAVPADSKSGFLEKVVIAGLIGTVVILYLSGAQ